VQTFGQPGALSHDVVKPLPASVFGPPLEMLPLEVDEAPDDEEAPLDQEAPLLLLVEDDASPSPPPPVPVTVPLHAKRTTTEPATAVEAARALVNLFMVDIPLPHAHDGEAPS